VSRSSFSFTEQLGPRMASEYAGALMCHQGPGGLVEIEVQRSGHIGVVPSIAALSKTSR
jgi:hypothetical protein